ncbi:putative dolichyl-diphosphooligosaccharide--protein glycosyltransferase subunit 3b [Quercus suber]|uniref:Dolichyl-diphosphooligosaccharide--protein glycosyltransferase subunit 3b n=1 Tax=Quercus suber TaxID=58331 RepID=A0AAW0KY01_QUESU
MDQGDFSRLAESMADFVQAKTKLNVGLIHRPCSSPPGNWASTWSRPCFGSLRDQEDRERQDLLHDPSSGSPAWFSITSSAFSLIWV